MEQLSSRKILKQYILVLLTVLIANFAWYHAVTSFDNDVSVLKLTPESFSGRKDYLNDRMLKRAVPDNSAFKARIGERDFARAGTGNCAVLVCRLNCLAYGIYFNDTFLGSVGDMQADRSNIRNSMNWFLIDKSAIRRDNELKIIISGWDDPGHSSVSAHILNMDNLNRYLDKMKFLTQDIYFVNVGLTMFGSLMILVLFLIVTPCKISSLYFFFFLALLFRTVFILDCIPWYALPFSRFTYQRLMVLALYLSITAVSMGIYRLFGNKGDKNIALVTMAGIVLIELISKDRLTFQSISKDYSLIIVVNALSWLYTSYRNLKKSVAAKMFLAGSTVFCLSAAFNAYCAIRGRDAGPTTSFLDAFIFASIAIILYCNEIMDRESQLQSVSYNYHSVYKAAITDEMTGLYNRAYMVDRLHKAKPPYSVVMLDIDDFKEINDSCGHRFGDMVVCHIALNLKKHVRSVDLVFRYGGDEFFMILYECPAESAKEIMTRIRQRLETDCLKCGEKPITITLSCGIYFVEKEEKLESIFDKVDAALYHSKRNGKNEITIYNHMPVRLKD